MSLQKEYGDFQTPFSLAQRVVEFIKMHEPQVRTIIEPTCGVGAFLLAAFEKYGNSRNYYGYDINPDYIAIAKTAISKHGIMNATLERKDFYDIDWKSLVSETPGHLLLLGNPPWMTNAGMGTIGGKNLPAKSNFQKHSGFAARTGKANFDISEWMLIKLIESLRGKRSTIAMLCKTATARKVLRYAWANGLNVGKTSLHVFDSFEEFGVSVDACLFYSHIGDRTEEMTATIYRDMSFDDPIKTFGLVQGELVSDVIAFQKLKKFDGIEYRKWRSGIKHDASQVMEFTREGNYFVNGLGERCDLEDEYLYPLLKSSDLANKRLKPTRFVLLTQKRVTDTTDMIQYIAPKTWQYLLDHSHVLDKRGSSIYKNRSRFAIFGVGDYSFAPAKVAVSGLYKNLNFQAIGNSNNKPIMVDDTSNFIPCNSLSEARFFAELLNGDMCQRFISSLVFSDAKRPVTIDVLKRVDLKKIAEHAELAGKAVEYLSIPSPESNNQGILVFEESKKYRTKGIGSHASRMSTTLHPQKKAKPPKKRQGKK